MPLNKENKPSVVENLLFDLFYYNNYFYYFFFFYIDFQDVVNWEEMVVLNVLTVLKAMLETSVKSVLKDILVTRELLEIIVDLWTVSIYMKISYPFALEKIFVERRLDGNYTRMLRAVLNKSWRQHPTRLQLYGHLPPITKTIQVRRTRHAGHCWRSKDELISDVLLWTPTHGCARVGRPARTYIQQLCEDTGCNPEDLPEAMNDREKWRETVRDIRGATSWWWWWLWCNCQQISIGYQLPLSSEFNPHL